MIRRPRIKRGTLAAILAAGALASGIKFCSSGQKEEKLREEAEISDVVKHDNAYFKLKEDYFTLKNSTVEDSINGGRRYLEQNVEKGEFNRFLGDVPRYEGKILWNLIEDEGNIIDKDIIKAIIYHETRGNFRAKCNVVRGIKACGLMQLQPEVIVSGLRKLYGTNDKLENFKVKYERQLERKKMIVNSYTNNYFTMLEYLERKVIERRKNLNKREHRGEGKQLRTLERTIIDGYYVNQPVRIRNALVNLRMLRQNKNLNDYLVKITGRDIDWINVLEGQQKEAKKMINLVRDNHNPDINVSFGDLYVASLSNQFGDLPRALGFYSGGYKRLHSSRYYDVLKKLAKRPLFPKPMPERIYY